MMYSLLKWPSLRSWLTRADNLSVTGPCPFDILPDEVLGVIFGKLCVGDRVRTRLVCKSWRDKLIRADFPVKPEPPWLFLPIDSYNKPQCFPSSHISFQSVSEEDRIYRFKIPKSGRWRCCGSSSNGGWLLMAGREFRSKATAMMLWDPISGATRKLPSLSTLPFFDQLVNDCIREGIKDITSVFTTRTQVFSVGSVECVVAVVFVLGWDLCERRLALCSPEDQSWSVLLPPVEEGEIELHEDILFHNGKLYSIHSVLKSEATCRPSPLTRTDLTIRLSGCAVDVTLVELMLVGDEDPPCPVGFNVRERWTVVGHLVGSPTTGELLVVSAVLDLCTFNNEDDEGPIPSHTCSKTRGFEIRRLYVNDELLCSERLSHIGDAQCIFLGTSGSTLIEGFGAPNCIHFATEDTQGTLGIYCYNEECDPENVYVVHERGVFFVPRDKIDTTSLTYLKIRSGSCAGWFTPKLKLK